METETEFDIKRAASQVVDEFERAGWEQARAVLEQQRRSRPAVVQEAIDRFVVADMKEQLLRFRDGSSAADVVIDRVLAASGPPRFPSNDEMSALASDSQRHDVYASIVATRGTPTAVNALARGERVLLGLRQENSTLESMDDPRTRIDESTLRSGKGVYDDRVLVIWNDDLGDRHAEPFDQANTEPTAQYDHHVGSDGRRPFADGSVEQRRIVAASGFDNVVPPRKIEGEDVDGDGLRDLGRLAEGTIEMRMGWHPRPGGRGVLEHALQPTVEAVRTGREGVQRDTNADGWFTTADIGGRDELNASFKIHRGSRLNTDSAGCQTIHFDDYARFLRVVEGNPH